MRKSESLSYVNTLDVKVKMSKKEKVDIVLRLINDVFEIGTFWGKAEAYEYMVKRLKKSHLKTSKPKLVLNTLCLSLDSASDALEKSNRFVKEGSPTASQQINILINTISKLSDDIRIAMSEKKYEEAFKYVKKTSREIETFTKTHEETFQVFTEVQRKRLEDMFT